MKKRQRTGPASKTGRRGKSLQSLVRAPTRSLPNFGFPAKLKIKHTYCDLIGLTSTSGVPQKYIFRANGMFDPDVTASGHQPMYYDQLTALYNHFTVISSNIKCTVGRTVASDGSFAGVGGGVFSVCIADDTVAPTAIYDLIEDSTANNRYITATQTEPVVVTKSWTAVGQFGPNPLANDNLQGSTSADPVEQSTYVLTWGPVGSVTCAVNILVEIEYVAIWDELKAASSS